MTYKLTNGKMGDMIFKSQKINHQIQQNTSVSLTAPSTVLYTSLTSEYWRSYSELTRMLHDSQGCTNSGTCRAARTWNQQSWGYSGGYRSYGKSICYLGEHRLKLKSLGSGHLLLLALPTYWLTAIPPLKPQWYFSSYQRLQKTYASQISNRPWIWHISYIEFKHTSLVSCLKKYWLI